ncbi:MAG: serine/threonine-protein kinase, partial [Planctomycetota bacterium]
GISFLVLELIEGRTLAAILRQASGEGPVEAWPSVASRLDIAIDLSCALAYAHGEGVVHRDLKPSNVMVEPGGRTVLLDLGLSHAIDEDRDERTATGDLLGTVGYMAPERWAVDRNTAPHPTLDVYSLGVILHQLFAPDEPLPSPHKKADRSLPGCIPPGLRFLVSRCLQSDPELRHADARAVHDALCAFRASGRVPGTMRHRMGQWRRSVVAALLLAIVACLTAVVFAVNSSSNVAETAAIRRAARLVQVADALAAGKVEEAETALETLGIPDGRESESRGIESWLGGALRTEREAGKGPEPTVPSPGDGTSVLGPASVTVERVPGRKGMDLVVDYPKANQRTSRLRYPGRDVRTHALSSDSLRIAAVAADLEGSAQTLDVWCGVSGTRLSGHALGREPVSALAELPGTGWIVGRESGSVEIWSAGALHLRKDPGLGPILAIHPMGPAGAWATARGERRAWVSPRVQGGAVQFQLGAPVRRIRFESEGLVAGDAGSGWRFSLDLTRGDIRSLQRGSVDDFVPASAANAGPETRGAIDALSLAGGVGLVLHEDRIEFRDESGATTALTITPTGGHTCAAYQESTGLLVIGSQSGTVHALRMSGWSGVPTEQANSRTWLEEASRLGFVPRASVAHGSWNGLRVLTDGGGAGQGYLGASGVLPGLPKAWYAYLLRRARDATNLDPSNHGAAVAAAAALWRLNDHAKLAERLASPPLATSTSPTVSLLRGLASGATGDRAGSLAWIERADEGLSLAGGLAGPLFRILRFEASAASTETGLATWRSFRVSIEAGIEDPDSWNAGRASRSREQGAQGDLATLLLQQEAAARLLAIPLLEALAAEHVDSDLHQAADRIARLAAAVLGTEINDPFTDLTVLGALRCGDPTRAVALTSELQASSATNADSRVSLLVRALVSARGGDRTSSAIAFNGA